jgi:hypothetical protein
MTTGILRGSDERQTRVLASIGGVGVLVIVLAVAANFAVNPFRHTPKNVISVAIETPYIGQGVVAGTPLIMHGVKVGEVTAVSSLPGGRVRLNTDVQSGPASGLTDAMGLDFRPANYFGVTGVNLIPAHGGQPLRSGAEISVTPKGNFALQALLSRLGELSHQVVTPRLVRVVDRATRYTNALNPLLETMISVSTSIANVQTVSTAQLLRNTTGINVAFPGFLDAVIGSGDAILKDETGIGFNAEDELKNNPFASLYDARQLKHYNAARQEMQTNPDGLFYGAGMTWEVGAEHDLFGSVGNLEGSHIYDLFPAIEQLNAVAGVVPKVVPAGDIAYTLRELRTRLERMYAGSGDQRALQVRVILDELPGVAGPMGLAVGAAG